MGFWNKAKNLAGIAINPVGYGISKIGGAIGGPVGSLAANPLGYAASVAPKVPGQIQAAGGLGNILGTDTDYKVGDPYSVPESAAQMPYGTENRQMFMDYMNRAGQFNAPVDTSMSQQARQQQQQFAQMLQDRASSSTGIGSQWMQQQGDMAARQAQALIASQRGINPALAAREGAYAGEQARLQAGQQAALIGMQERHDAQGQLGDVLANTRGYDVDTARLMADSMIKQQTLRQSGQEAALLGMSGMSADQIKALMDRQRIMADSYGTQQGYMTDIEKAKMLGRQTLAGGLLGAGGSLIASRVK